VENYAGDAYRAVYTVRFEHAVYVLHAFQKKSNKGVKTSETDKELVRTRLKQARDHAEEYERTTANERGSNRR
jgi:phage-related protein